MQTETREHEISFTDSAGNSITFERYQGAPLGELVIRRNTGRVKLRQSSVSKHEADAAIANAEAHDNVWDFDVPADRPITILNETGRKLYKALRKCAVRRPRSALVHGGSTWDGQTIWNEAGTAVSCFLYAAMAQGHIDNGTETIQSIIVAQFPSEVTQ